MLTVRDNRIAIIFRPNDEIKLIAIQPIEIDQPLLWLFLLLGSALALSMRKSTPGKALFRIEIVGTGCALCRETRRLLPPLIFSLSVVIYQVIPEQNATFQSPIQLASVAIGVAILLVALAYYIIPWIRWRGAMPWDRATGFQVTRA
ncbi:MAG: hypothetical protein AAF199_06995 [Pseudomonadota bacterium]